MADYATKGERHKPRRRNKDTIKATEIAAGGDVQAAESAAPDKPWMQPNEDWAPEVQAIFMAMQEDTMRQWMTPVSWAQLYLKCSAWSREFKQKFLGIDAMGNIKYGNAPLPGAVLADISKTLDSFGGSEKARREMKILIDPNPTGVEATQAGDARMSARKAIHRPARRQIESRKDGDA